MKKILFFIVLFSSFSHSHGQREPSIQIDQTTSTELQMSSYAQDRSAKVLVLYKQANYYRDDRNNYRFVTNYYKRIKNFNKDKAQNKANIDIYW